MIMRKIYNRSVGAAMSALALLCLSFGSCASEDIQKTLGAFKEMLDDGSLTIIAGVELSFLSEEEQALVLDVMEQNCIKLKKDTADKLRAAAGAITTESVQSVFGLDKPVSEAKRPVAVKLPAKVYSRYFANVAAKDVQGILEAALEQYFMRKGA